MAAAGVIDDVHAAGASRGGRTAGGARPEARRRAAARLAASTRDSIVALPLQRVAAVALARRSAGRQYQRNAERRARGANRGRRQVRGASLDAAAWQFLGRRGAAPRSGCVASIPRRARGDDVRAGRRRPRHASRAVPARQRAGRAVAAVDRRAAASEPVLPYLERFGSPIRYSYVPRSVAGIDVSDGLRHRAGQRRDAIRRASLHRPSS